MTGPSDPAPEPLGDLSEALRGETRADLLAGSMGYQHFLERLSQFISPAEAGDTQARFRSARRFFWLAAGVYLVLYFSLNAWIGPQSILAAAWANDLLRGGLVILSAVLATRFRVGIAAQLLLPLAVLSFLPFPVRMEIHWWIDPLIFAAAILGLFAAGWCFDAASDRPTFLPSLCRWLPFAGVLLLTLLNLAGYFWMTASPAPPVFSILSAVAAAAIFLTAGKPGPNPTDVEFLYAAAWKRYRFFITGRALAVVLGCMPLLLFTNLLDYQEEVQQAMEPEENPHVLRVDYSFAKWESYFWLEEGRFLEETDFTPPTRHEEEHAPVLRAFYLIFPSSPTTPEFHERDPENESLEKTVMLPESSAVFAMEGDMLALDQTPMTRERFLEEIKKFEPLRITSKKRLAWRTTDALHHDFLVLAFHQTPAGGMCFAEKIVTRLYDPAELDRIKRRFDIPKWIFLTIGVLGVIFLWRRGGDSSLSRWLGIWLVGVSLIPLMTASDDTLPHLTHWLWRESVMVRWNSFASIAQPIFNLLFIAAVTAATLWVTQTAAAICWTFACWPTPIHARYSAALRPLVVTGKIAAVCAINVFILGIACLIPLLLRIRYPDLAQFDLFIAFSTAAFLVVGGLLRFLIRRNAQLPPLGPWPVAAFILLNLSVVFYAPAVMFIPSQEYSPIFPALGNTFALTFIFILGYLILRRDFLHVRAIAGITTLLLIIAVPLIIHEAEESVPHFLASTPFFRERGAEMISIMLVILLFPVLHHRLHELLQLISVPRLRKIEHRVEHALEAIVDADDDQSRAKTVSELFARLDVPRYLFLSRRPGNLFSPDINQLPFVGPPPIELSAGLRQFLGHHRHFIDLNAIAYEWPFFFHQFELHRFAQTVKCRYLLPISVGDSLRALLLIPDGPEGSAIADPAVSANLNNFGIAAALSRPPRPPASPL